MAKRKAGDPDPSTEKPAAAVLDEGEERAGEEPAPTFPDSKADPKEDVLGQEGDVEYVPTAQAPGEEPEAGKKPIVVDDKTKAKNLGTALQHERARGKRLNDELAAERERTRLAETEADRLRGETSRGENLKRLEDAQDLIEALPAIKNEVTRELEPGIVAARKGVITLSQKIMRRDNPDYDDVITKSGVAEMISIDPSTGKPKDPTAWRKIILTSDDPGQDAYDMGLAILEARGELQPLDETKSDGATEDTRRPVIEVRPTADRFGGVRRLPTSAVREPRRVTDADIDKMSDAEYAKLPKHVREAHLAAGSLS